MKNQGTEQNNVVDETEQNGLLDFNWESEDDFTFGAEPESVKEEEELSEEEQEEKADPSEKEEELNFFNEDEEGDAEDDDSSDKTVEGSLYSDAFKDLKEHGIFKHVEVEEDEEISAERLIELQEQEYEIEMAQRLNSWASSDLDPDAQAFIKFKLQGGETKDFFSELEKSSDLPEGDINDVDFQDEIIRYQLRSEGDWSEDEIEDRLEYLESTGKKKDFAKRYDSKLEIEREKKKEKLLEKAKESKQISRQQEEDFKKAVKTTLSKTSEVNGFKFTPKEKDKYFDMLTKRDHKLAENKMVTGFQKKMGEILQDTEKLLLLTKLIDSDFDFSGFKKKVETNKVKQVKSNIQKRQSTKLGGFGSSTQGESLANLFD